MDAKTHYQILTTFKLPLDYSANRPFAKWLLWQALGDILISSWLPGSLWRIILLKLFGAKIGQRVLLKPNIKIKFPWRLVIGDSSWIGENVWIDILDGIRIGSNVCISHRVDVCTGSVIEFGSIVYDSIPAGVIASGIPAIPICRREII